MTPKTANTDLPLRFLHRTSIRIQICLIIPKPKQPKALNSLASVFFQKWAGRSVWYDRRVRNAEAAGSNPARSTTFNASFSNSPSYSNPFQSNNREILVNSRMLEEFDEFMRVNMRLEARTALDTREHIVRYLAHAHNVS
jgi:hypothetical protein